MRILLILLLILTALLGCSRKVSLNGRMVGPHSLLDPNTEIPDECKPPLASDENKIAFVHFRGRVNRCVVQMEQTPDLVNYYEVNTCLKEISESFKLVTNEDCRATVQVPGAEGNVMSVMFIMLENYFSKFVNDYSTEDIFVWDNLADYLSLVGTWFDESRDNIYPRTDDLVFSRTQLDDFYNEINRPLWDAIDKNDVDWRETFGDIIVPVSSVGDDGQILTDDEVAEAQLNKNMGFEIFKTMLKVNKKFIDSVFASDLAEEENYWTDSMSSPAASPVLAIMVGDAIFPVMERIRVIAKIYDVACKLSRCNHKFYLENSLYWMLNYFREIETGVATQEELSYGDTSDELSAFLDSLAENQGQMSNLIDAFNRAFEVDNISYATLGTDFPEAFKSIQKSFSLAHYYFANYENTRTVIEGTDKAGFFVSSAIAEINVGFSKANIDRHVQNVRTSNEKLKGLRERFNSNKHTLISEIVALKSKKSSLEDLENTINDDITDVLNEQNQVDAIRHYIQTSRKDFAKIVKTIIEDPTLDSANSQFASQGSEIYNVNAALTYEGDSEGTITGIVLQDLDPQNTFKKGDVLMIRVENEWSPTCAVSAAYGTDIVTAKTGPKGFHLTESDGEAKIKSVNKYSTKESYSSKGISVSACAGGNWLYGSVQTCATASFGTRKSKGTTSSSTSSSSERTDASFSLGIALENTPYPDSPAGSLLLVEMPRGSTNRADVRSVQVLDTSFSYVVKNDYSDFYLVGNDCQSNNNTGSLNVTVDHKVPQGSLALDYISKIADVMDEIQSRAETLIEVGQLTYDIKESIKKQLKGSIGINIDSFSGQIKYLIESFIDNEVGILAFKSQVVTMERSIESKKRKIESLLDQYASGEEEVYLRAQTRNWLLSNLDLNYMNTTETNQDLYTLNRILNILEHSLVSYLDFKYRNDEKDIILGDISLLQELDISNSFDKISDNLYYFVNTLLDNITDDLNNKPLVPKLTVGLKIPNPYYEPTFEIPQADFSLYPVLNETKARNFWDNLINWTDGEDRELALDLDIADLYTDEGLECFVESPIIETMALFFIPENEAYITDFNNNYRYQNAKMYLEGISSIPFAETVRIYKFVDPNWRYMDVGNRMAKSDNDAIRMLTEEFPPESTTESGLATGRPPFGKFKIGHLRPYRTLDGQVLIGETPINEIKEIFVGYVMSASNNNFDINMSWIPYCAGN